MTAVQTQNMQNQRSPYAGIQNPATTNTQVNSAAPVPATNYVPTYPAMCYPPQYYCGTPLCASSCPAVEININNPMTHTGPLYAPQSPYSMMQQTCCSAPMPMMNQVPMVQQKAPQQVQQPQQQPQQPAAAAPIKKEEPKKDIIPLTDEYIKSLENYLNNPNTDVRVIGVKELSARFKEDKTRRNDQALTNLMNKALQDPSQKVRLIALGILDGDTAEGDKLTYQILQNMQKSNANYNQDSVTASEIMLHKAGRKFGPPKTDNTNNNGNNNSSNNAQVKDNKAQKGQNLNVIAG